MEISAAAERAARIFRRVRQHLNNSRIHSIMFTTRRDNLLQRRFSRQQAGSQARRYNNDRRRAATKFNQALRVCWWY